MDWQNKFYSIVRETEENLAKAKVKLASKTASGHGFVTSKTSSGATNSFPLFSHSIGSDFNQPVVPNPKLQLPYSLKTPGIMSEANNLQVLYMQEQIDMQRKTIDQLQRLVQSLDREREFYKQQISQLRGEIDGLSEKMNRKLSLDGNERQMSLIKQDVIREIDKVKTLLHNQSRESRGKLFSDFDDGLWTVKENLAENLEHVRRELGLMNKRIERMEVGLAVDPAARFSNSLSTPKPTGYVPSTLMDDVSTHTSKIDSILEAQHLRSTIHLLNTKLDNLEKKVDGSAQFQFNSHTPLPSSTLLMPRGHLRPYVAPSVDEDIDDNLSCLSDLSDLSSPNYDDNTDYDKEIEEEIDAIIRRSSHRERNAHFEPDRKSSLYKASSRKEGKVEFDLSDLDLSDVDGGPVDVDSDWLDS